MNFITSSALKILDCDIANFPPATVAQRLMARRQYAATDSYRACIGEKAKHQIWKCKRFIKKDCPDQFDKPLNRSKLFKCYNHFHVQRNRAFGNLRTFKKHSKCMQDVSAITQECTKALIESCEQRICQKFQDNTHVNGNDGDFDQTRAIFENYTFSERSSRYIKFTLCHSFCFSLG